jgi:hypothetical protein
MACEIGNCVKWKRNKHVVVHFVMKRVFVFCSCNAIPYYVSSNVSESGQMGKRKKERKKSLLHSIPYTAAVREYLCSIVYCGDHRSGCSVRTTRIHSRHHLRDNDFEARTKRVLTWRCDCTFGPLCRTNFQVLDHNTIYTSAQYLHAFGKLRKATVSFVMSVCPSVRMEQLASFRTDFQEIWYLSFSKKLSRKFKFD